MQPGDSPPFIDVLYSLLSTCLQSKLKEKGLIHLTNICLTKKPTLVIIPWLCKSQRENRRTDIREIIDHIILKSLVVFIKLKSFLCCMRAYIPFFPASRDQ